MKREYSFKDARKTVKEFNYVLNELDKIESVVAKYKTDIVAKAEVLIGMGFFEKKLTADLETGRATDAEYGECITLIQLMFGYFEAQNILEECVRLHLESSKYVREQVVALAKCKNIITWLFANKLKKEQACSAYKVLKDESVVHFYSAALDTINRLNKIESTTSEAVLQDIKKNELKYQNLLFELKPEIIEIGKKTYYIENLKYEYGNYMRDFERLDEDFSRAKEDTIKAIDEALEEELKETLKKIPLEELNRDKNGIKVSALKEFGYTSIENVYTCTHRYLVSMPGIGEKNAGLIESIAARIVMDTRANLKLSLTTDKKTFYTTKVVHEVYKYREKRNVIIEKDKFKFEVANRTEKDLKWLDSIANGVSYYFASKQEKEQYIRKYNWIKMDIKDEKFAKSVKEINNKYKETERKNKFDCWIDFAKDPTSYYSIIEELYPSALGNEDYRYGLPEDLAKSILEEPLYLDGLKCTLRHYQEVGTKYILHQKRVLLGDEMGLGKTIQALAAMVSLRNTGATHFLVVCPASVLVNWCREIQKHTDLHPIQVHGNNKQAALEHWIENGGVAVTTFETTDNIMLEEGYKYAMLVVDEAHYIKNPEALRTEHTIRLSSHAERILFMTGTALENKVDEMIGLIGVLNKDIHKEVHRIAYMSTAPEFKEKVAPVYYRRKRDEVLTELPEKIEYRDWCTMTPEEEKVYEDTVLNGSYPDARRVSWHIDDLKYSSKANRLLEIIEEAKAENRKAIIFSFFLDTIDKISKLLEKECVGVITGAISSEKRQEIIDNLEKAPAGSVIIAQIIAGGTGLNIQSASVVVICEPQFKPSTENQAISRAYRMGQARNVLVHRLLCDETIDERITDLLEEKQKIFDTFADKSVANEKTLEVEESAFTNIMKDEAKRIEEKRAGK